MSKALNPERALLFRITHRDNVPWLLANGCHCKDSRVVDPKFVQIGNPELIDRRQYRLVSIPPGGTLSDYIPFYFTPFSPMMYNIRTGYGGIRQRRNDEIVIIVTSLYKLCDEGIPFVFTDRHAYLRAAEFSSDLADLDRIDWKILQSRDFKRDPNDLEKIERYQAEGLVYKCLPISALLGIACYDSNTRNWVTAEADRQDLELNVRERSDWYF